MLQHEAGEAARCRYEWPRIVFLLLFGLEVIKFDDILTAVHFHEKHQGLPKVGACRRFVLCPIQPFAVPCTTVISKSPEILKPLVERSLYD